MRMLLDGSKFRAWGAAIMHDPSPAPLNNHAQVSARVVDTSGDNGAGVLFNAVATTSPCFKNRVIFNNDGVSDASGRSGAAGSTSRG
jgi:hypothetical protein